MTSKIWSKEEMATLRRIRFEGRCLEKSMDLLPKKTYWEAEAQCRKAGIKHASVETRALRVMVDGKPRTAAELATEIGASRTSAADALRAASVPGENQSMHVCGFTEGGRPVLIYVIGPGLNEQPRVPRRENSHDGDDDAELDRLYRSSAAWWPHADPVVIASINAMVHAGRAPA